MKFQPSFRRQEKRQISVTPLMLNVMERIEGVHTGGAQMVLCTGPTRNGKTTLAEYYVDVLDGVQGTSPDAYRGAHHQMGEIAKWSGNEQKKAIRSVYEGLIGNLDEGTYRRLGAEALAGDLVQGLVKLNIQLLFIDEACGLSLGALGGLKLIVDIAARSAIRWPLTMILIGMRQLPLRIQQRPELGSRVHDTCYFTPYDIADTSRILADVHRHFRTLNDDDPRRMEQVAFIHEATGGLPGFMISFLDRLDHQSRVLVRPIDLQLMRVTKLLLDQDLTRALDGASYGYEGPSLPAPSPRNTTPKSEAEKGEAKASKSRPPGRTQKADDAPSAPKRRGRPPKAKDAPAA